MNRLRLIWKNLTHQGLREDMDFSLRDRLILTNQLGLINIIVSLLLIIVFGQRTNANLLPFVGMMFFGAAIPLLNRIGLNILTRFVFSILPCIVVLIFDMLAKSANIANITILTYASPRFVITASIAFPLTLFLWKERFYLIVSALIVLMSALGFDIIYGFAGINPFQLGINTKSYSLVFVNICVVLVILLSSYIFLVKTTQKNEMLNRKILADFKLKNEELNQNEEQLRLTLLAIEVNQEEDEKRNWVDKSLADFALLLRSQMPIWKLYNQLLAQLVRRLNAHQACLYILNEDNAENPFLELKTAYGVSQDKINMKTIAIGEGLIGQTFANRKEIFIKDIPDDYFKIESGLGSIKPKYLVFIPLILNQKAWGVIEITSLKTIESHHIEFLLKLSEAIATTIANFKAQAYTEKLLAESQQNNTLVLEKEANMARMENYYIHKIQELEKELQALKKNASVSVE